MATRDLLLYLRSGFIEALKVCTSSSSKYINRSSVGRLLDPLSCIYYRPLPASVPYVSMVNLEISVSGWVGDERTEIVGLIKLLGAKYNDKFNKKVTHLICKETTGLKYQQ